MAYVDQAMKAARAPVIRELLKKYGLKGTLSIKGHMELRLTVTAGSIDFIGVHNRKAEQNAAARNERVYYAQDYIQVNTYWIDTWFDGRAAEFLKAAVAALKGDDYYDHSDIQSDYFNTSHYVAIKIGKWNKPYVLTA